MWRDTAQQIILFYLNLKGAQRMGNLTNKETHPRKLRQDNW